MKKEITRIPETDTIKGKIFKIIGRFMTAGQKQKYWAKEIAQWEEEFKNICNELDKIFEEIDKIFEEILEEDEEFDWEDQYDKED